MKNKISVAVKKDREWFIGHIEGSKFIPINQIKKLSDVKNISSYVTLKTYVKKNNMSPEFEKDLLKKTGLDKIYILNRPIFKNEKEFEKHWLTEHNDICKTCTKGCKQSKYVTLVSCPDYERKN